MSDHTSVIFPSTIRYIAKSYTFMRFPLAGIPAKSARCVPSNVTRAANLFQTNGWFIRGEPEIRAEDPARTTITGNFKFDYSHKQIDVSGVPFMKKAFRIAHTRMEYDPDVWTKVEELILESIKKLR